MTTKTIVLAAALGAAGISAGAELKLGIIGCDTSHAIAFTKLMNVEKDPDLHGHRVVAAYQWGSRDIVSATNRYPQYIAELKGMGVEMTGSIAELLGRCDAVFLETNDGRPHYEQALEVFRSGKRVFIDKPIAASLADAVKIVRAAREMNASFFCSSALRFTKGAQAARAGAFGAVRGADVWTPESFEPSHSDYYWYAIHGAEPLFTIMGRGCEQVTACRTPTEDVLVGRWADGRLGVMRALGSGRKGADYGGCIFTEGAGVQNAGTYEGYRSLLLAIVAFFETGAVPVTPEETLEIYAFLEAGAESVRRGGVPVALADVLKNAQ
ncbi:MAG: Gfo/Idh/MocA family oxidoreductase [Kiritimatiellae bacterium]|nr:Gfo/Idh/MocA family oxidoreductase [Kiritimatiellia bacterium]